MLGDSRPARRHGGGGRAAHPRPLPVRLRLLAPRTYFPALLPIRPPEGLELTPGQRDEMARVMESLLPAAPRGEGFFFDTFVSNPAINAGYAFADITVPTLVVTALDDSLAFPERARTLATQIPGARLVTLPSGGHALLGQAETVRREIGEFLTQHGVAPAATGAARRAQPAFLERQAAVS